MSTAPFTEEHQLFRKAVRSFVEQEIVPHVDAWEERGEIPPAPERMGPVALR